MGEASPKIARFREFSKLCTEENFPAVRRRPDLTESGRLPPPLVMPSSGLDPRTELGIQAASSVIVRGHRPWMRGCWTSS